MRDALQYLSLMLWFPLVVLLIGALLRGPYRRYPVLFAYTVAIFLTAVVELAAHVGYASGAKLAYTWATYYWIDDGIRQALLFAVVISLLYLATKGLRGRAVTRLFLIAGAILIAGISFLIHYDRSAVTSRWMTQWTRDLDLTSAILALALWAILLQARKHDPELLMLSGALGIRFTGEAIGHALRNQFPAILLAADTTIVLANLTCLFIWWQVLRASPVGKPSVVGTSHR